MPLSELVYRMAKGKLDSSQEKNPICSTDLSSGPENDFVELVWENGQIQSNRARKIQFSSSFPSQTSKARDRDIGNVSNTKMGRFGVTDPVLGEVPMSVTSIEMGLNQDDDMVPWLNYPIEDSIQPDSEFLVELSGVTVNEEPQNNYASMEKRSCGNQSVRDPRNAPLHNGLSSEQGHMTKASSTGDVGGNRPRNSATLLYSSPSQSQQCQTSFPYFRSRVSANNGESTSNLARHDTSGDSIRFSPSGGGFPSIKVQKQVPVSSTTNSSLMNFSHFSRPAAFVKANLHSNSTRAGSGISSIEKMATKDKVSIASCSNPGESILIDRFSGSRKEMSFSYSPVLLSSKVEAKQLDSKSAEESFPAKQLEGLDRVDSKNDKNNCLIAESATRGLVEGEKTVGVEPMVVSSSVCSGNSVERVSDEPTQNLKRKFRETEESEGPSEDVEEESVGAKKAAPARGGAGSKRSRAAEVHNLSERRRRDRINEKMRALQELIPNCNKVDKASMLDEAIEYLKTLQLQVQIMSMGAGLYMPSMLLPSGMPHMHAAQMAQFSPMGVGMGMGFGMGMPDMMGGSSGCSMIQVPPMHGAHFPGPSISPNALHGMGGSNLPIFGLSTQGHPMSYPCAPLLPMSGGPLLKTTMGLNVGGVAGPLHNLDSSRGCSSKDSIENISSQAIENCGANSSMNQTSSQCQVTNEHFEQSALVQNSGQASEVADRGALKSTNGNDNAPIGATAVSD